MSIKVHIKLYQHSTCHGGGITKSGQRRISRGELILLEDYRRRILPFVFESKFEVPVCNMLLDYLNSTDPSGSIFQTVMGGSVPCSPSSEEPKTLEVPMELEIALSTQQIPQQ